MIRYILKVESFDKNGEFNIFPDINASKISIAKEEFTKKFYDSFMPDGTIFKGMFLDYGTEFDVPSEPHALCDMHSWFGNRPEGIMYPVSDKFKNILLEFNIPYVRFYEGSVWFKNKEVPYNVFHILNDKYSDYINFDKSTFYKGSHVRGRLGDLVVQEKDLNSVVKQLDTVASWLFERAVMKPIFRDIDIILLNQYHLVVSERLKDAIESAGIVGVKFEPCPVNFEYSDEL